MEEYGTELAYARRRLDEAAAPFVEVFGHGTLRVELYRPEGRDEQTPHDQDELYVVVAGAGSYACAGTRRPFGPGDVLFAPAGAEHRFEDFGPDFLTWVVFYGPKGGEARA